MIVLELWFTEYQSENIQISFKIKDVLYKKKSKFQDIVIYDTEEHGRLLAIDDVVMLTTKDEFVYHEMITHVPLLTHGNATKVLVIGGGDGGTVRELCKHPVEEIHLVEIDADVIKASKEFLPTLSCGYKDLRVKVFCEDGIEFVKNNNGYDVIIVDSTDPIGPAEGLFSRKFYKSAYKALNENGIMVAQTESPLLHNDLIKRVYSDISSVFAYTNPYTCVIPTYPGALWSFTIGSKTIDPISKKTDKTVDLDTNYYNKELHNSYFILPPFFERMLK